LLTIDRHLEIATDSKLDLANELIKAKHSNKELQGRTTALADAKTETDQNLIRLRRKLRRFEEKEKQWDDATRVQDRLNANYSVLQQAFNRRQKKYSILSEATKGVGPDAQRGNRNRSGPNRNSQQSKSDALPKASANDLRHTKEELRKEREENNKLRKTYENATKILNQELRKEKESNDRFVLALRRILEGPTATIRDRVSELLKTSQKKK
jgi:hypothetical protein